MTALGFLYPGHSAEDDYPRIEQLLNSDVRLHVVHTGTDEDAHRPDASPRTDVADRLAAGVPELRLSGAEAVVWASSSDSFVPGWYGAHEKVRSLALAAGLPASSTSFAFAHAVRGLGARCVAVAVTYPQDVAVRFEGFLKTAGIEVVATRGGGVAGGAVTAGEVGTWGREEVLALARGGDHPDAEAVLLPDTALHTAAHIPELEEVLGKPVLTASQVTVWEALRLAGRRVREPVLGTLFARSRYEER